MTSPGSWYRDAKTWVGERVEDPLRTGVLAVAAVLYLLFVALGPQLYISELVLLGVFLVWVAQPTRGQIGYWLGLTMVIWAFGTLLSDIASGTDWLSSLKGQLRIAFLWTTLCGLFFLVRERWSGVFVLWGGMVLAALASFLWFPNIYAYAHPWKFGFAAPFTIAAILALSVKRPHRMISAGVFIALAALHFQLGARSLAVVCGVVAVILVIQVRTPDPSQARPRVGLRLWLVVGSAAALSAIVTFGYDGLARLGVLGEAAQLKALYQASGPLGSLLSSRTELLLSLQTIRDNPLFGGGSFSVAGDEAVRWAVEFLRGLGYPNVASDLAARTPSYHSELFGSVAENGLLAAPFWFLLIGLFLASIHLVVSNRARYPELLGFLAVLGIWDVLFSPYGGDRRFWLAATLVVVVMSLKDGVESNPSHKYRHDQLQPTQLPSAVR